MEKISDSILAFTAGVIFAFGVTAVLVLSGVLVRAADLVCVQEENSDFLVYEGSQQGFGSSFEDEEE